MVREAGRKRLTTDRKKIFVRECPTIMSVTKAELHKLYIEIFDRLQEYEVAEETGQIVVPPCKAGKIVYLAIESPKPQIKTKVIESIVYSLIELDEMVKTTKKGIVEMVIPNMTLLPAKYILDVAVHTKDEIPIDKIHHILEFQVKAAKKDFGVSRLDNHWIINNL